MALTIDHHVLLPWPADWNEAPRFRLQWESEVEAAVRGNEQRGAYRSLPRPRLTWKVAPESIRDNEEIRTVLNAAFAFTHGVPGANEHVGKACCAWWGKASWVDAIAGATLTLATGGWAWSVDDYVVAYDADGVARVRQITAVVGSTVTLDTSIPGLSVDDAVYPVFFGRLQVSEMAVQSYFNGDVPFTLDGYSYGASASGPIYVIDGLRWELPVTSVLGLTVGECAGEVTDAVEIDGARDYMVTVRFRGVVELKAYTGGTQDGYFYEGGAPDVGPYNIYKLEVSDPAQTFFLNAGIESDTVLAIDYERTFRVNGGSTITITANSVEGVEVRNFTEIVVPGVPPDPQPFDGQFIQMDVVEVASL